MKTQQLSTGRMVFDHLYLGVLITLFYIVFSPSIIQLGLPSIAVLLIAELLVLAPVVFVHLKWLNWKQGLSFKELIPYHDQIKPVRFVLWTLAGIVAIFFVYVPLYPLGIYLRESLFGWLPEWYFNPVFGTASIDVIAKMFLVGMVVDGLVGPIAEEFFFRAYLLPRMVFLKNWAPIVNGLLFGLYHFWQPHNILATAAIGIILAFVTWKTRNVYVAIIIHCVLNIVGAYIGYLGVISGALIER